MKARQAYGKGRVAMMRPHAWVQILNVTESKHLDTKMRKKALQGQAATVSTFPLINGGLVFFFFFLPFKISKPWAVFFFLSVLGL